MTSSTVTNYEGIEIDIPAYEFNGMASDQVGGINRTYPIEGGFNWDYNYLSLVNFACSGYALHHSTYYISSYYGIVGIESERFDVGANVTKTSTTKGTISFPSQEIQSELNGTQILMLNICPSTATRLGASVNGSYEIKGFSHVNESRWHKVCGGNLETALDFEIKVNDYKVRNDATGLQTSPWYNTVINLKDEYTHYVEQNINSLDVSSTSGQAIVTTTIKNPKNNDHVETYDLYIVPGAFTSINNTSFSTHKDKGHDMGVLLKSGIKADGAQQTVSVNDFYPEIKGLGEGNMNDKYTLYLKANYTKSSGLEPTFHALATQMVTTGLESIEAEEVDVPAIFFNMNGVQVDGENMAPGVYIKKEGNKTSKVVIR
ncbi:MAG: hypothetical protein J1E63_02180 [Muribaculaceae bacterium]|nr:hypothetical protein [Muribaculaceae bacterium]